MRALTESEMTMVAGGDIRGGTGPHGIPQLDGNGGDAYSEGIGAIGRVAQTVCGPDKVAEVTYTITTTTGGGIEGSLAKKGGGVSGGRTTTSTGGFTCSQPSSSSGSSSSGSAGGSCSAGNSKGSNGDG